ncbi:hypothetical protein ACXYUI_31555, partial [Klebsiella pneumoniae]
MAEARSLRYLTLLRRELRAHQDAGRLTLSTAHACVDETNGWIAMLRKKLDGLRAPLTVEPVVEEPV